MEKAQQNADTAQSLVEGVKEYKGAKVCSIYFLFQSFLSFEEKFCFSDRSLQKNGSRLLLTQFFSLFFDQKITEAQKEAMDDSLAHISKMAVTHNIKVAGRIDDMEKAQQNADTAHSLVEGVKEYKGAKVCSIYFTFSSSSSLLNFHHFLPPQKFRRIELLRRSLVCTPINFSKADQDKASIF
jgi:signal transduction protein with GAF and PtsI domain